MKRSIVEAFAAVLGWFQAHFPEQWPAAERAALEREAKDALKRDPEVGGEWYVRTAQLIRDTGWWC